MPKIDKAIRRDNKREKNRRGMQVKGLSNKTLTPNMILRRAEKLAQKKAREQDDNDEG